MPWQKPSPDLVDRYLAALSEDPRVERRRMFGLPCAFTGGNMFSGVHEAHVIVRLSESRRADVIASGGAPFTPMGRPMKEYVVLPDDATADRARLAPWLVEALDHTATLPPKTA